jgi:uncharacterized membrane protein YGL010W
MLKSRAAHVIGLAAALVLVLILGAVLNGGEHLRTLALVCGGFVIGWITAFIRFVFVERVDERPTVS